MLDERRESWFDVFGDLFGEVIGVPVEARSVASHGAELAIAQHPGQVDDLHAVASQFANSSSKGLFLRS